MELKLIKPEDRLEGEEYLCTMKHGMISGFWSWESKTCSGYYWRDIEWYPIETYQMPETEQV